VVSGQEVGTVFKAVTSRTPTRLLWLAHATTSQGQVVLDAGAITAVVERRLSLLPAGIKRVSGFFTAGDAIDICDENLSVVARGISSFDSEELPNLIGRRTSDLVAELGSGYDREVIHRDDIVILKESS
jgi:glutamate 5-kinase